MCRRIKTNPALRGTHVVVLTAHAEADARRRAREAGADGFLTKPFSPLELVALINRRTA